MQCPTSPPLQPLGCPCWLSIGDSMAKLPKFSKHHSTKTIGNDKMVPMDQAFTLVLSSTINKPQSLLKHWIHRAASCSGGNSDKCGQIPAKTERQLRTSCYSRNLASNGSDLHEINRECCGTMRHLSKIARLTAKDIIND